MFTYKHTIVSCFVGYIVQAIVNNFVPLLFILFQTTYGIPLGRITLLVTVEQAAPEQLSLWYINHFSILCGLLQEALENASLRERVYK